MSKETEPNQTNFVFVFLNKNLVSVKVMNCCADLIFFLLSPTTSLWSKNMRPIVEKKSTYETSQTSRTYESCERRNWPNFVLHLLTNDFYIFKRKFDVVKTTKQTVQNESIPKNINIFTTKQQTIIVSHSQKIAVIIISSVPQ
jgi:hypothetical protein